MENSVFQYKEITNPIASYVIWGGITFLILTPIVFIFLMTQASDFNFNIPHPSDNELIANFQQNEEDFNKLILMSNENSKVERITFEFTRPKSQTDFSKQRWDEYRNLFNQLKLKSGIRRENDTKDTIIFLTSFSKGMLDSGSSKGYAYSEKELKPIFDSLDEDSIEFICGETKHGVAYKKIKNNWYLSYDW